MICPRLFHFALWPTLILFGRLVCKGRTQTTDTKIAYACSKPATGNECIIFNITCGNKEIIRIRSAYYGFGKDQNCMNGAMWNCGDTSNCCAVGRNDRTRRYTNKQFNDLVNDCSSKESCKPQAAYLPNDKNTYSIAEYKCVPEEINTTTTTSSGTKTILTEGTVTTATTLSVTTTAFSDDTYTTTATSSDTTTTFKTSSTSSTAASAKFAVEASSSEDVPVAAIVCPVALVLIGTIVGFIIWRKRHLRHDKLEKTQQVNTEIPGKRKPNNTNLYICDNLRPHINDIVKTNDNYIVLQEQNTYNYIDHSEVQNIKPTSLKTSDTAENIYTHIEHSDTRDKVAIETEVSENRRTQSQTKQSDKNNYFKLEPKCSSVSDATNNIRPDTNGTYEADKAKLDNMTSENHNYFILEPQGIPTTEQSSKKETAYTSDTGTHNYSILEPQSTLEANSNSHTINGADDETTSKMETNDTHNYFVLEQQDTYSSIDPNDVVVQTLPDDEYNVLNTKKNIQDPNYDEITAKQHAKEINENDDYSHLENALVGNQPLSNYSRVNLKKAQADKDNDCEDQYSHLGSTLVKPSSLRMEENDVFTLKS